MSLKTWKKEFYIPVSKVSKKNALQHSLTKWIGLRKENLEKHGVEYDSYIRAITFKGSMLEIDAGLCKNYDFCEDCPLKDCKIEYRYFIRTSNPEPMISLIQQAIDKDLESK